MGLPGRVQAKEPYRRTMNRHGNETLISAPRMVGLKRGSYAERLSE